MNHTPGPWIAKKGAGWYITRPDAELRREAALAVGMSSATTLVGPDQMQEEAEANARLMAAAPKLLKCLKMIFEGNFFHSKPGDTEVLDLAAEAIREAGGMPLNHRPGVVLHMLADLRSPNNGL